MARTEATPAYTALCRLDASFGSPGPGAARAAAINRNVTAFQADVAHAERSLPRLVARSAEDLLPAAARGELPPAALRWLHRYAVVDALALYYRSRYSSSFIALLAVAFLAMVAMELFAHLISEWSDAGEPLRLGALAFPLFWLIGFCVWHVAHSRRFHDKYHDYRALAEGLRVQLFWNMLGLNDRVEDHYLHKQEDELEWICRTIACWREQDRKIATEAPATPEELAGLKALVRRHWVAGQTEYYQRAALRARKRSKRCRQWASWLFWSAVLLSGVLAGWEIWYLLKPPAHQHHGLAREQSLLVFAIATLVAAAAIYIAYAEKMAFAEHARQYTVAHDLYRGFDEQISRCANSQQEMECFRALGRASLQENGDWLLLHRDRPLEIIVP